MIAALWEHMFLLFTFRHQGAGLPSKGNLPYLLLAGAALTTTMRGIMELDSVVLAVAFALVGFGIVLATVRDRLWLMAAIALGCMGGDVLAIAGHLAGFAELSIISTAWQIAAIGYFCINRAKSEAS